MKFITLIAAVAITNGLGAPAPALADGSDNCATFIHDDGAYSGAYYEICAGSVLDSSSNYTYHPENLSTPERAWCEGVGGSLAESLDIYMLDDSHVTTIILENGYNRTESTFVNNARARSVTVRVPVENEIGLWEDLVTWPLADTPAPQVLNLPENRATELSLRFESFYEGAKYADFCISSLEIRVE